MDHVRRLVQSGEIPNDTLAWRPGQPNWDRVGVVIGTELQTVKTNRGLGIASFCIGIAGVFAWFVLLAGAGLLTITGAQETGPMIVIIGLLMILGAGINLLGTIFGLVAICRKDAKKALSVAGPTLNAVEMIAFAALMIIGSVAG